MEWIIITIYGLCLLFTFVFSLNQLHLTRVYVKNKITPIKPPSLEPLPRVTVQLPIYNEKYVIERLIDSICNLDYPKSKLDIQVLDDSNDDTLDIVAKKVATKQQEGYDIAHIRRAERKGFKAGALAHGTALAKGEFITIFDADFLPQPDFLQLSLPYFEDTTIGCVQARWGHVNKDYSLLTELQAFGLDAHFTIEQSGRNWSKSFINFNGTAGTWRKSCIEEAGGWSAETLTEDLDLSYRAQLKGWKFHYAENIVAPAELPIIMPAVKSQQYRWNKGAAETAKKNLLKVWSSDYPIKTKVHATFHLLNSSIFLSLIIASVISLPLLFVKPDNKMFDLIFNFGSIFLIGFISIAMFYYESSKAIVRSNTWSYYLKKFPLFLTFSMGMSLHNALAVSEGLIGKKTPFIRTPKFNVKSKGESYAHNQYVKPRLSWAVLLEGLLCIYFAFGVVSGLYMQDYIMILFHSMLSTGFGLVFFFSLKAFRYE